MASGSNSEYPSEVGAATSSDQPNQPVSINFSKRKFGVKCLEPFNLPGTKDGH